MKKRIAIICVLLVVIYLININFLLFPKSKVLTGSGITTASVSFVILDSQTIFIDSPLNQSYNFSMGDPYTLDLNVSATFNVDSWSYTLWDMRNNVIENESIAFSPNTTFNAVRGSNKLIVHAINPSGDMVNESVDFFINLTNSAPYFGDINSSIFICENEALSYFFNVTDVNEEVLQLSLTPTDPFYLNTIFTSADVETSFIELFSSTITEDDSIDGGDGWKMYEEKIEVTDQEYSDTAYTNITAVRVNDAPVVETIGVQTVWTVGDDSTFYKEVDVTDEEDGNQSSGNLGFNISFLNSDALFNITDEGIMNFTPNSSQVGVYNISICVNDTGIDNAHEDIFELCGQDAGSITTCENFSLTVTNENRAPTITDYYPENLIFSASGTSSLYFNISEYDPDETVPDAYWYVDGVLKEYDAGSLVDEFTYTFGCNVSGVKTVKAEITDGLLNDSIEWSINVGFVECAVEGGGGGGGGGGAVCNEKWVCGIWGVCQNTEKSLGEGLLSGEDYRIITEDCLNNRWYNEFCGLQVRGCFDVNKCNTSYQKPPEFQSCHYTEKPSCEDGIKNCHDGACELLVDCGGPCSACPSCSDKIQNQGEEGVDCGGPCPWKCEIEKPFLKKINFWYLIIILVLLIILTIIIIIKLKKIEKYKERIIRGI